MARGSSGPCAYSSRGIPSSLSQIRPIRRAPPLDGRSLVVVPELVLSDAVGSYFPEFQRVGLAMIAAQGGIFGWVAPSSAFLDSLTSAAQ